MLRRFVMITLCAAALALMLAACGATPTPVTVIEKETVVVKETVEVVKEVTKEVTKEVVVTPTPVTMRPQVLRWSIEGINELVSIDPPKASDSQGILAVNMLFAGLVRLDGELRVTPDGATSWTVSPDGLTYTFKLRPGLAFSDGTPATADDVVFSLTRALNPATGGWTGPFYLSNIVGSDDVTSGASSTLTGVKAVDASTVEIKIKQPSAFFLKQLTFAGGFIVPEAKVTANPANWTDSPIGTGPFKLKEWKHNQALILEPNPYYWNGPIQVTELQMPFFQDSETAFQLYRTGGLDIMGSQQNGVPAARLAEVSDLPDFRAASSFAVRYIGFNNMLPPFDNVKVRQAFARAIDKQALATKVLGGSVRPSDRILPGGLPGSELPIKGLTFDAAAAKQLLADAGFANGKGLPPIAFSYGVEGDNERVVTFLQEQWKQNLGVQVTLEPLELATFSERLNTTYQHPEQGIQMYFSIWGADYPDPQNFISQQLRTDVGNNNGHWSNAAFDKLVDEADVIVGNDSKRMTLYNQAEQLAVDEVGWLPLFNPTLNVLMRPYVSGFVFTGQGITVPDWSAVRGKTQ
ncbi:MAG: peptide ABC transporter substrate-binding protein [Anaerolineae bacterium]